MSHSTARAFAAHRLHPSVLAGRWAVVSLAATLASGVLLRAAMAWPSFAHGANLSFGVHAHSHVAFFGWIVLAVAALAARQVDWIETSARQWRLVVHALGTLSLVALAAFAVMGYAAFTIALSAVHVLLWIPLARLAWPLQQATDAERAWWRAAWMTLLAAGAATLIPGVLAARGIRDGWWREFGIKLFLAFFINGFAGLAAMGLLVARRAPRHATTNATANATANATTTAVVWARRATMAALLPLAVLYVATPPPLPWLGWVGRAAVGVVGVSTIIVAVLAWTPRQSAWIRTAIVALGVTGVLQGLAAAGVGAALMHDRSITIAFTHLMLLLGVTPILAVALSTSGEPATAPAIERATARTATPAWRPLMAAIGATTMCAALAVLGWPWLGARVYAAGIVPMDLFTLAAAGGALAAGAWFTLLPFLFGARAPEDSQ